VPERIDDVAVAVTVELVAGGTLNGRPELLGPRDRRIDVLDVDEQCDRRAFESEGGALVPMNGEASSTITTESPISISAWAMVPPGPGNRMRSVAPNASA
jgi:hypothetical protein